MLALLLSLTVQRPALAALDPSDAGAVTVREWAAMLLCTFGDDEGTRADQDCLVEAYRRGWLSLSGVLAPDAALCRGALYESAFAAGDLPVYDWSLYPGGAPLSDYENCLRIGAELGLCPSEADRHRRHWHRGSNSALECWIWQNGADGMVHTDESKPLHREDSGGV